MPALDYFTIKYFTLLLSLNVFVLLKMDCSSVNNMLFVCTAVDVILPSMSVYEERVNLHTMKY